MKLVYSPPSSIGGSDTGTLDRFFRVSNIDAIKCVFEHNLEKINEKEPKVIIYLVRMNSFISCCYIWKH